MPTLAAYIARKFRMVLVAIAIRIRDRKVRSQIMPSQTCRTLSITLVMTIAIGITACVDIPMKPDEFKRADKAIQPGVTTKTKVIEILGKPDWKDVTGQRFHYVGDSVGQLHCGLMPNPVTLLFPWCEKQYGRTEEDWLLEITFDEKDLVKSMDTILGEKAQVVRKAVLVPSSAKGEQRKLSATDSASCKTRYCGHYYGYMTIKGRSRAAKVPVKFAVSDGTITSAIPAEKSGECKTKALAGESLRVRGSGNFAGKYKTICEIDKWGRCRVTTAIKGWIDDDGSGDARHQNRLHLSGVTKFNCLIRNEEVTFESETIQAGSGTPPGGSVRVGFMEEVQALLGTSSTEPLIGPLLNAEMRFLLPGH